MAPSRIAVGIDVSKDKLDACIVRPNGKPMHKQFDNDAQGRQKLLRWAEQYIQQSYTSPALPRPTLHFCMEATGSYSEGVALMLADAEQCVSVVNPFQIKHYGMGIGALTKNDKADAKLIAEYCRKENPAPWRLCTPEVRTLLGLVRRWEALKTHHGQEYNRMQDPGTVAPVRASLKKSIAFLEKEMARVQEQIDKHISGHPGLKQDRELLLSIPGVGPALAMTILAELPDVTQFDSAQSAAAYAGLNPKENKSGKADRPTRMSKCGNARLRAALYMPAMSAFRHNPLLADLYARLIGRGRKPKAALGAVMRKLLMLAYGVLKTRTPFDPAFAARPSRASGQAA